MSVRYKLAKALSRFDGGQAKSTILREYVKGRYGVKVGKWSYGGCFEEGFNRGGSGVSIGRYCSFAASVRYFGANHPVDEAVLSAAFYNKDFAGLAVSDVPRATLCVGNDVWVGYGAIITAGCRSIGNGAVVGAGSVVTHDVEAYSVVAGSPARPIRRRFSEELIELLESSRWWELEPSELYKAYAYRADPGEFARRVMELADRGR